MSIHNLTLQSTNKTLKNHITHYKLQADNFMAARGLLRILLFVTLVVCLPASVSAQGFLFLQLTDHIPLPLWFTQNTLRQRSLLVLQWSGTFTP
ncbi:putative exported protein [Citrobacter rodentium ICC168]|uniref:Exported protein n=1 Tax=Citrobacter rodentium (strain ICC168) TaxID=637910 RepID=D2TI23_CITRI|nr:putative exported protein [Citrobacter rodentium ICC168]